MISFPLVNEVYSNKIRHEIEIKIKRNQDIMKHLHYSPNQTARRFFRTNALVFVIRNCCVGIRISLLIFGHYLRVAGLNTWARIAAIFIQILEWHGKMVFWSVSGRNSDCARAVTGTVVYNILDWSGANPSVREQILQSVMHYTISEAQSVSKSFSPGCITRTRRRSVGTLEVHNLP